MKKNSQSLIWMFCAFSLLCLVSVAEAQEIRIALPAAGAAYKPGDLVTVQVVAPVGSRVFLMAPAAASPVAKYDQPYIFTIEIPRDFPAGPFGFSAAYTLGSTQGIIDHSIKVDPVVDLLGARLVVSTPEVIFNFVGEELSVGISLESNGIVQSVADSDKLLATPKDVSIVLSERGGGNLVAAGAGLTFVRYKLGDLERDVSVQVKEPTLRGDFTGDGHVDVSDIAVLQDSLNATKKVPNDARDLNRDGKIDALDLRVLTTLCSRPRCAAQ